MAVQLTEQQILALFTEAAAMAKQAVGFHPAFLLGDPVDAVRTWVMDHPDKASALAQSYQQLITRYMGNSGTPH